MQTFLGKRGPVQYGTKLVSDGNGFVDICLDVKTEMHGETLWVKKARSNSA